MRGDECTMLLTVSLRGRDGHATQKPAYQKNNGCGVCILEHDMCGCCMIGTFSSQLVRLLSKKKLHKCDYVRLGGCTGLRTCALIVTVWAPTGTLTVWLIRYGVPDDDLGSTTNTAPPTLWFVVVMGTLDGYPIQSVPP